MDDCVFCKKIKNNGYVYSDTSAVAFPPLNPVTPGHYLVVPRVHITDAMDNWILAGRTMKFAARLARQFRYESVNFITSAGAAATQTVFHMHLHIVPRREGDGLLLPWSNQGRNDQEG